MTMSLREELSLGVEVEAWLPDISKVREKKLVVVRGNEDLFRLVATVINERVDHQQSWRDEGSDKDEARARLRKSIISADIELDWGRCYTASGDASISPTPQLSECDSAPFPVEIISKIMSFDEVDVTTFCDIVSALRAPPLSAQTNESTGLHVHVGKMYSTTGFFSLVELGRIIAAYLRFENTINESFLPMLRRENTYCRDLNDAIAMVADIPVASNKQEIKDATIKFVSRVVKEIADIDLHAIQQRVFTLTKKVRVQLVGDANGLFARVGNNRSGGSSNRGLPVFRDLEEPDPSLIIPPGMILLSIESISSSHSLWRFQDSVVNSVWNILDTTHEELLALTFGPPQGFEANDQDSFRRVLLRDALLPSGRGGAQSILSGAQTAVSSPNKYYKLNLARLGQPAKKATLEFRQFPGKDLSQTLIIWGWLRFVGSFVTRASEYYNDADFQGRPTTSRDLFDFLQLSHDSMQTAWFREVRNSIEEPRAEILRIKQHFVALFDDWLTKNRIAHALKPSPSNTQNHILFTEAEEQYKKYIPALVAACDAWRSTFHSASALRSIIPGDDTEVWGKFSSSGRQAADFLSDLAQALIVCLDHECRQLRAAEACSRLAGLTATAQLCCSVSSELSIIRRDVRAITAAVADTRGDQVLPEAFRLRLQNLSQQANELTVAHAANLLNLCEEEAQVLNGDNIVLREQDKESLNASWSALRRTFFHLTTSLLAPRVHESALLWEGLAALGWHDKRVQALNQNMERLLHMQYHRQLLSIQQERNQNTGTGATENPSLITNQPALDFDSLGAIKSRKGSESTKLFDREEEETDFISGVHKSISSRRIRRREGDELSGDTWRRPDFRSLYLHHRSLSAPSRV